jgi:hypothetical protein
MLFNNLIIFIDLLVKIKQRNNIIINKYQDFFIKPLISLPSIPLYFTIA